MTDVRPASRAAPDPPTPPSGLASARAIWSARRSSIPRPATTFFRPRRSPPGKTSLEASPETVALWTLAHQRYPDEPVALFNLGATHFLYTLRYDLAAEVLGRIGERPTDSREILGSERLGYCLLALGKIEQALAVFERLREVAPR